MNIQAGKWIGALVLTAVLMSPLALHAQSSLTFPITAGTSPALNFNINSDGYGSMVESAPLNGSLTLTLSSDAQMAWIPALGALRAGSFAGSHSASDIGEFSVAFGDGSVASNYASTAMGSSTANGNYSTSMGYGTTAIGDYSLAGGAFSTAYGGSSVALGEASANNDDSIAIGFAVGSNAQYSTAMGAFTSATSYDSFVIGMNNAGTPESGGPPVDTLTWVGTDPLFEVGNGNFVTGADALVVYKNGDTAVQGNVAAHGIMRCHAGGDLTMGTFTAGTAP